ncbi:FAD-binding protein [Streptomyces sp. NRRL F-4489]|uniref:FAD/NAD(P)-binding protein n=1 Tax=Streptomyces sp. NRRL F-4489 TaxID=1609095 RepID=UPI0007463B38|nr:FAD/NAD(P)-binding protein [Streptomyces sp. NRRL F-4489]KUL53511.1 FAD-binding protein [Streptomyces sp. NRRL F-4489]
MHHSSDRPTAKRIGIVGAGPRGLSVLERLCANAADQHPGRDSLHIHLIDPYEPGPGRVWRTDQPRELLMNTVASQVTIFTDDSVECEGPILEGPSLYEWARFLSLMGSLADYPAHVYREARRLGPNTYPSRSFYGHYLRWAYQHIVATAPSSVTIRHERATALALEDTAQGSQKITLSTGQVLRDLDAVILAQGHLDERQAHGSRLAAHAAERQLTYLAPSNPADADLSTIQPGEVVALRGLGLNFFDYLALLTTGRGGHFEKAQNGLAYRPSGREPTLLAGSRRGIPYHARGENEKGVSERHDPLFLTPSLIQDLRNRAKAGREVNFRRDVWPLVSREVQSTYYATLLTNRDCRCTGKRFLRKYRATADAAAIEELLDEFGIAPHQRWSWERIDRPYTERSFTDVTEFNDWLLAYLRQDIAHAAQGNVSDPLKAALDVMRDLRNEIRLIADHGGISGTSYHTDLDHWYTPLNAFLSIGPPVRRVREMVALIEAGVLRLVGPQMTVHPDRLGNRFLVTSAVTDSRPLPATAVIEARLPETDIRSTQDALLTQLTKDGAASPYRIADPAGPGYQTGGLAVTERPYRVLDVSGAPHPSRFAYGIPTEHVHWVTAAGVRPGVNSVILGDSDAIARAALAASALGAAPIEGAETA